MIDFSFEYLSKLQYKVRSLSAQVQVFKTGEKYEAMHAAHKVQLNGRDREIRNLKSELAEAHVRIVTVQKCWSEVFDDLEKEHTKELAEKDREIRDLKDRILQVERQRDTALDNLKEQKKELYQVMTELEDEKGKNLKLTAQINKDYENSSKPSSADPNHKKIPNNREKTGKKPGGQPGHKGHKRKKHQPTNSIYIPAPEEFVKNPNYRLTNRTISKQMVNIRVITTVDEYVTPEFRHKFTGQRVHADFPDGMVNEVNYGGSIKAFLFMLNNYCNVSIEKTKSFLSELTHGQLHISTGLINGLAKEFSQKSEPERKKIFHDLVHAPVLHTDLTTARINGQNKQVLVCVTALAVLYFAREHKGHEAIKGTPIEVFLNTLVHDHDTTFYNYGKLHQECLEHILRYLVGIIENEPDRKWPQQMWKLIREMIHFHNGLDPNDNRNPDEIDPDKVMILEQKYDDILQLAQKEYEYDPPSKYYKDGFKLSRRLLKYKDSCLLFLHDWNVPHNNNIAERMLRLFKRKLHQAMTFRSFESLSYLCDCLGIIASLKANGDNLHDSVAAIFDSSVEKVDPSLSSLSAPVFNNSQSAC